MKSHTLKFIISSSFKNFWRNFSLSLSVVSVLSVTFFSILTMVFISLITDTAVNIIHQKVDLSIDLRDGIALSQVDIMKEGLKKLEFVVDVSYIPKEKALSTFKQNYGQISAFLDEYNIENPFRSSLQIVTKTPSFHQDVIYFLSQDMYKNLVDIEGAKQNILHMDRTKQLILFTTGVKKFGIFLSMFFILIAFLIIFNTIRILIFYRRSELELMYLVGASNVYTKGPFYFEAIYYSFFASSVALALFYPLVKIVSPYLHEYLQVDIFRFYSDIFSQIFSGVSSGLLSFYTTHIVTLFLFLFIIGICLSIMSIFVALFKGNK